MKPGDNRNTPKVVVDAVRRLFGGVIDLDPCSNKHSIVRAVREWSPPIDGLSRSWHGAVFCNAPWSNYGPWVRKACDEAGPGASVCLWAPNNTDTEAGQLAIALCDALCFWRGREIHPLEGKVPTDKKGRPTTAIGVGNVMYYFGDDPRTFRAAFSRHGEVIVR